MNEISTPEVQPQRLPPFLRFCDWVSSAMGSPRNIAVWLALVLGWTGLFAFGGPRLDSGSWLPAWFASTGYNFPLNLVTTVAELFIGFLVAAASNRSERNLEATLARMGDMETKNGQAEADQSALLRAIGVVQLQLAPAIADVAGPLRIDLAATQQAYADLRRLLEATTTTTSQETVNGSD